jgi:hypothetical protein
MAERRSRSGVEEEWMRLMESRWLLWNFGKEMLELEIPLRRRSTRPG